jgi:two-component system, cell cycle sensor histidine kinase and response regulator CckA
MTILGYTSLILMNTDPHHPNYEKLKIIERQVQSGADLTSRLSGFARGGKYETKTTDLNELLTKSSDMFGRTKKEISLYRRFEKNLWTVEVDRGQVEQVFLNLFVNAWQAMPGGGEPLPMALSKTMVVPSIYIAEKGRERPLPSTSLPQRKYRSKRR